MWELGVGRDWVWLLGEGLWERSSGRVVTREEGSARGEFCNVVIKSTCQATSFLPVLITHSRTCTSPHSHRLKREAPQQRDIHPQVPPQQREAPPEVAQPIRKAVADDVVLSNARHLVLADPDLNA